MECAERYSNILASKNPADLLGRVGAATADAADEANSEGISMEEVAKATLCEALRAALSARHFPSAKRALQALALDAYGLRCPEATFEFLAWLQSVDACARAEDFFEELLPEGHGERVQLQLLRELEARWPCPSKLASYRSVAKRIQLESPRFQRLRLQDLPPISEILTTSVPALTLVVTLQVHDNFLYLGAACTPPDGDPTLRLSQVRHMVTRIAVQESELNACMQKMMQIKVSLEKDMITSAEVDETLAGKYLDLLAQAEEALIKPVIQDLVSHFWQYGLNIEHPSNPKQLLFLPDAFLWPLPFERFASFSALFGSSNTAAFARDFSLHLLAQRTRTPPPTVRPSASVLLTDSFNEDRLRPKDDPKSETMCMVHKRLVEAKVISNAEKSLHGQMLTASPEDIKVMLTDSTMFFALGFGRFFSALDSRHFVTQDLRHLKLVAIFHRAQNDDGFRRQTKRDSMKSIRQQAMENSYGMPLLASFRGVGCIMLATEPIPVNLSTRCFETFAKSLQAGKTVAKALEDVLAQKEKPEFRYVRTLEGGLPPGSTAPLDPKKKPVADNSAPPPEGAEDLLPRHTRTAYLTVGLAWAPMEAAEADVKKKK